MFGGLSDASASLLDDRTEDSVDDVASPSSTNLWKRLRRQRQEEEKHSSPPDSTSNPSYFPPPSRSTATSYTSSPLPPVYVPSHIASVPPPPHLPPPSSSTSHPGIAVGAPLMAPDPLDAVEVRPSYLPSNSPRVNAAFNLGLSFLLSTWTQFLYYLQHSRTEMKKRKFNYCLGSVSCFVVVTVAAVCYTLIARAPVVFLQQAEAQQGQFDARLNVEGGAGANFINYTQLTLNLAVKPELGYHSPRQEWDSTLVYGKECVRSAVLQGFDLNLSDWKYTGMNLINSSTCTNTSTDCLTTICPVSSRSGLGSVSLVLADTERERSIGLGRLWSFGVIPAGQVIITEAMATAGGLRVGDILFLTSTDYSALFLNLVTEGMRVVCGDFCYDSPTRRGLRDLLRDYAVRVQLTVKVFGITPSTWAGKLGDGSDDVIMMEYGTFLPWLIPQLHPALRLTFIPSPNNHTNETSTSSFSQSPSINYAHSLTEYASLSPSSLYEHADHVLLNLSPSRIAPYMSTNYDDIQDTVVTWSSGVMYYASFPQLSITMPILSTLYGYRFFSLFLGLILSVILTILFILSTMLIYSLLMISIETRTFELGVHRMVGMTTVGIIKMLLVQASSYSVPAWVVGLIISQLFAAYLSAVLEDRVEVPVSRLLTPYSIFVASVLGLAIPLLAAILPIRTALGKNLHDSLDTQHSKTMGVKFNIERSEDVGLNTAWLAVGTGFVVFGFLIYYLLPLSLLSFNLSLFFNLFFGLLLGLLFGLILLALNFQHILEKILLWVFFWWEKPQVPQLVAKNLIAHRMRNRKTSIMFALSLGFIIFITVAYNMEITSAKFRELQQNGQSVTVSSRNSYWSIDAVGAYETFLSNSPQVDDWAWVTNRLGSAGEFDSTYMTNLGHAYSAQSYIYGVSSNFYECTMPEFLIASMQDPTTSLPLSEQLYTVRGAQSAIVGTNAINYFHFGGLDVSSSFLFSLQRKNPATLSLARLKPMAFLDLSPRLTFTQFPTVTTQTAIVSLSSFVELSAGKYNSIRDLTYTYLIIKQKAGNSNADVDLLITGLKGVGQTWGANIYDSRSLGESLAKADAVMALIFDSATYVAMGLCLFSLMASMFTNIYEQSKEIAILRAMGLPAWTVIRIYTYEAFVLVWGASLLGMCIGALMSATMSAQRVLFTQLPVSVPFPWQLVVLVLIGSFVCAIVASCLPARRLMQKKIASIMRTVL